MTVNPNGEAEVLKVYFKPRPRLKKVIVDLDFSTLAIKGRQSQGNLFSRYGIHKIVMKERGASTLGSQRIWFDDDVHRLNTEGRGYALGAFKGDDKLLVWTPRTYYITGYDLQQHFPDDTVLVERYRPERVYAVCYFDREQNYYYLKRFTVESGDKTQFFLDEEGTSDFVCRTGRSGAQLEVTYAGAQASRPAECMEVDGFVGVKSHRAKGKRVTTFEVASLRFVEPDDPEEEPADTAAGGDGPDDAPAGDPAAAAETAGTGVGHRTARRAGGDAGDRGRRGVHDRTPARRSGRRDRRRAAQPVLSGRKTADDGYETLSGGVYGMRQEHAGAEIVAPHRVARRRHRCGGRTAGGRVGRRHLPLRGRGAFPRTGAGGRRAAGSGGRGLHRSHGGGLPTWSDNMEMLAAAGRTVYLRRSAESIAARLSPYGRAKRPRLQGLEGAELVEFMRRDIAGRESCYAQASLVLDCDALSDEEAVERIIRYLAENE